MNAHGNDRGRIKKASVLADGGFRTGFMGLLEVHYEPASSKHVVPAQAALCLANKADAGCSTNAFGTCSGTEDVISFDGVYRLSKRFDAFAGVMYSGVRDGLASGFPYHTTDITTTAGVRFKF